MSSRHDHGVANSFGSTLGWNATAGLTVGHERIVPGEFLFDEVAGLQVADGARSCDTGERHRDVAGQTMATAR